MAWTDTPAPDPFVVVRPEVDTALSGVTQSVMTKKRRVQVNLDELDQIIDRSTRAPLGQADSEKLKTALHAMAGQLMSKRTREDPCGIDKAELQSAAPSEREKPKPSGHGRNSAAAFGSATRVSIPHATLQPGHTCPECGQGKVYRQNKPATLVRIAGQTPLQTTVYEMERLSCNACGQAFPAVAPEAAKGDRYDATAVAMIALLKYGTGVPFKRLERLEAQLAMPLQAAVQWELVTMAAKLLRPIWKAFIRLAAQGSVLHNDDTSMRILRLVPRQATNARASSRAALSRLLPFTELRCSSPVPNTPARTSPRC